MVVGRDDVDMFIPKTVLQFRDVKKSSWSQMIADKLETCQRLSPFECQVQFLGKSQPRPSDCRAAERGMQRRQQHLPLSFTRYEPLQWSR